MLELVSDHFHLVVRTVEQLGPLLESARNGDWEAVEHMTNKVAELETLADSMHCDAVLAVSKGAFFAGTGEDVLQLIEKNDVADVAQNAARILAEAPVDARTFGILCEEPKATLNDIFSQLLSAVELVEESIKALKTDEAAVSKSLLVERAEKEADEIKNRLIKRIFKKNPALKFSRCYSCGISF